MKETLIIVMILFKVFAGVVGQEIKKVDSIMNQQINYQILKQKAKDGNLDPTAFHQWIHIAQKRDDPGLDSIVTTYVTNHNALLKDKEMLIIILDHVNKMSDVQLTYLYQNKFEVARITERTLVELETILLKKLIAFALVKTSKDNRVDFDAYQRFIALYIPEIATLETQKLKIKYWAYINEYGKALDELAICIINDNMNLSPMELARLMIAYAPLINSLNQTEKFIRHIKMFSTSPSYSKEWYCSDLAILALYIAENKDQKIIDGIAERLKSNDQVPVLIKSMSDKLYTIRYK